MPLTKTGVARLLSALALLSSPNSAQAGVFSANIRTSIEIAAPREIVWQVLTDFACYPQWNPFITGITGVARQSERLFVTMQLSNSSRTMRFRPKVLLANGQSLRWRGRLLLPGLFDGTHSFSIVETTDGHVRLEQSERFSGLLLPFAGSRTLRNTRASFELMNGAIKARAEALAAPSKIPTHSGGGQCADADQPTGLAGGQR